MRSPRYRAWVLAVAVGAVGGCASVDNVSLPPPASVDTEVQRSWQIENEYVVKMQGEFDVGELADAWSALDPAIDTVGPGSSGLLLITVSSSQYSPEQVLEILQSAPNVQAVQPNAVSDPLESSELLDF